MTVETHTASIDTMSVTIKALHVSNKQMTLAVFRQLPKATLLKADGSLTDGELWGIVRYQIKDEGDTWVVISRNGQLYRANDITKQYQTAEEAERAVKVAEESLEEFRKWEAQLSAWTDWERDKSKSMPTESRSSVMRRNWYSHTSENDLQIRLNNCRSFLPVAARIDQSVKILASLPQLFIAV